MRILTIDVAPSHVLPYCCSPTNAAVDGELGFFRAVVDTLPQTLDAILVASDLQGVVREEAAVIDLAIALAEKIARMQQQRLLPPPERLGILLAGDLHGGAGEEDVSSVWVAMAKVGRWVAGVVGNHDRLDTAGYADRHERDFASRLHLLDGSTVILDGLRVGGLSGVVSDHGGHRSRAEADYNEALRRLLESGCDIVMLHDGPNVAETNLTGWPSLRRTIERTSPVLAVRGHDHWKTPLATLANGTQVLNVEGRVVVLQVR